MGHKCAHTVPLVHEFTSTVFFKYASIVIRNDNDCYFYSYQSLALTAVALVHTYLSVL